MSNKEWGGARTGAGRRPGLTDAEKARREAEFQKFKYMSELSDREPTCPLPVDAYCQTDKCFNMTKQGLWQMRSHVYSIRPICNQCIKEGGHAAN